MILIISFQCYEIILQQDPNHMPTLHNLCATYFHLGKLEDAEICLKKAVVVAPKELYIQHHLNLVQQHREKLKLYSNSKLYNCSGSNCNIHSNLGKMKDLNSADDIIRL